MPVVLESGQIVVGNLFSEPMQVKECTAPYGGKTV